MINCETQETSFSLKICMLPIFFGTIIALLNIEWMRSFLLINAPQADSLVYMTESFNDFWSLKNGDLSGLFKKYFLDGNQQTSPLLWWLAALAYFLLGLDPINAYLVISVIYLIWVAGVIYLAWCIYPNSKYALACGLMATFLPSVVSNGLRNFMLDFVAAAPFIWATAFLVKSDLGYKRGNVIIYSVLCGITVLFRTTLVPYFLSHLFIILFLAISKKRHPHYRNMLLAVLVGTLTCGGFIFPNMERIFSYYGYWATQNPATGTSNSFINNLGFYFNLVNKFHLEKFAFIAVMAISVFSIICLMLMYRKEIIKLKQLRALLDGLIVLLPLALVPTIVLSFYSSRAASVDYPFIAVYLMVPTLLWKITTNKPQIFWVGTSIMILALWVTQANYLFKPQMKDLSAIDHREREVIRMILDDAQKKGKKDILIGNTAIHQHNYLSYKYWILGNHFPSWLGHVNGVAIGRTNSATKLAKMNASADYVITAENYKANWHPNNVVAPIANEILQNVNGMVYMPKTFEVPGGVTIRILAK